MLLPLLHLLQLCAAVLNLTLQLLPWPNLAGATSDIGQYDIILPPLLMQRHTRGVDGLATVLQQQPQSQMPPCVFANYAMGLPWVSFHFRD